MKNLRTFTATAALAAALILTPALTTSAQAGVLLGDKPDIIQGDKPPAFDITDEANDESLLGDLWRTILGIILC